MSASPSVAVFDVNETLSDMAPMAGRFTAVGAPATLAQLWFASLLRDGFALTATGGSERFAVLADDGLRQVLSPLPLDRDLDAAVAHILAGFSEMGVHPDVVGGVAALLAAGLRLVTLSNGSTQVGDALLSKAGIRGDFEKLLSVEDPGVWKPAGGAYTYAARSCGVEPADMILVAVHPWDIHGASTAGLATAWVNRRHARYPAYFDAPTHEVATIDELARLLRP